jgi:type IV pilus assembly protein PilV
MRPSRKCSVAARHATRSAQEGVVLIEAMVAILIFSMGILAVVGLQSAMIKNTTESKYRSEASYIAQARIGQIWADSTNAATYVENATDISTVLPSGTRTVTQPATGQFTVTVTWRLPGTDQPTRSYTTTARITGG